MTYIFDSSFEGLLCCVFNAFSRHEQPGLLQRHDAPRSLFHDELNVITDGEQSDRVWNAFMGRKTKRTCGWWRDNGVSARNISELNGYRRRDGGKTKRFKSLHAFILD